MNRALLVGINKCEGADGLYGCQADVERFADFLQADCGFAPSGCRQLLDPDADHIAIPAELRRLVAEAVADPGSTAVFYYSGHGFADRFGPELVPALVPAVGDYSMLCAADWRSLPAHALNSAQFAAIVEPLMKSSSNLVAVFDCCHVGGMHALGDAIPKGIRNPEFTPARYGLMPPFFATSRTSVAITACAMNETTSDVRSLPASGIAGPGGAFSMFLLQELALRGGTESLSDVCRRVSERLAAADFIQTPAAAPAQAAAVPLSIFIK